MFCMFVAASLAAAPASAQNVYVQAMIVSVDADFARKIGWIQTDSPTVVVGGWETEVNALIRAAKAIEKIDIFCRPALMLVPGQAGFFQNGQFPVVNEEEKVAGLHGDGITPSMSIRVTPTPSRDGCSVKLHLEVQSIDRPMVAAKRGAVSYDSETAKAEVVVPNGNSVCVCVGNPEGKKTVRLAFFSSQIVKSPSAAERSASPVSTVEYTVPVRPVPAPNPFVTPKSSAPPMMPQAAAYPNPVAVAPPAPVAIAYAVPVPAMKPAPEPATLPELVAAYRAACECQDGAAATRLAVKALALDPTCFR